jgi:hypothetical protein
MKSSKHAERSWKRSLDGVWSRLCRSNHASKTMNLACVMRKRGLASPTPRRGRRSGTPASSSSASWGCSTTRGSSTRRTWTGSCRRIRLATRMTVNLYAYVGGNPANRTDPAGLIASRQQPWLLALEEPLAAWLSAFLSYYNARRPRSALRYGPPASRLAGNNVLQLNSYRTLPRRTRFTIASRMTAPISEATSPMTLKSF